MTGSSRISGAKVAYGVDLSGDHATLVRGTLQRGQFHWEPVSGVGAMTSARKAMERGRAVAVGSMPTRDCISRWLVTTLPSLSKARQVLPALLDIELPFPLEQAVYRFPVLRKTADDQVCALALAAREIAVEKRIAQYGEANWNPVQLEHEGVAIWDRCLDESPPAASVRIIAYLGEDRSFLVLGRDLEFVSSHSSPVGFGKDVPGKSLDSFMGKARRVLTAEVQGGQVREVEWIWAGPGAADRVRVKKLEGNLRANVRVMFETMEEPETFLARALAVRGLKDVRTCGDLRIGSWMHPAMARQISVRRQHAAAVFAGAALLFIMVQVGWLSVLSARDTELQRALTAKARELAPEARMQLGQEVETVRRAPEQQQSRQDPFVRAFRPGQEILLTGLLSQAESLAVKVETCSLNGREITLRGVVAHVDTPRMLADYLREQGYLLNPPSLSSVGQGMTRFVIKGVQTDGR